SGEGRKFPVASFQFKVQSSKFKVWNTETRKSTKPEKSPVLRKFRAFVTFRAFVSRRRQAHVRSEAPKSKAQQPRDLRHKRSISQPRLRSRLERVVLVGPHEKELAARTIFPPVAQIAAEGPIARAVLEQRARKHAR